MADELNIQAKVVYTPSVVGISSISLGEYDELFDVNGSRYVAGTQLLDTASGEEIDSNNELNKIGYCFIKNIGSGDAIIIIRDTEVLRVRPGEFQIFRPDSRVYAKSADEMTYIEYFMVED